MKITKSKIASIEKINLSQLSKIVGGGDTTTTPVFDVQEGKKGLNAVNVKKA